MIKRLTAFLVCMAMLISAIPVMADSGITGPDIVITDVRINNPYFTKGSDIRFEVDTKNIGNVTCASGWAWVQIKSGAAKRNGGTSTGCRGRLRPGL